MSEKNYISREGYEKLLQELEDLRKIRLPGVIDKIAEARSQGDLSENFDYKAAVEERELIESRIIDIEKLLANIEIVDESAKRSRSPVVDYGSIVRIVFDDGKEYKIKIVGSGEVSADKFQPHISLDSPVGMAIKGKKAGDTCVVRMSTGKRTITILAVQ